jgi:hypothetical protein
MHDLHICGKEKEVVGFQACWPRKMQSFHSQYLCKFLFYEQKFNAFQND